MTRAERRVEVVPATVTPALQALRDAAQACNEAGWRLTSHTPLMPPGFMVGMRARWEELAGRLHLLAADLELTALHEWARLSAIESAGGAPMTVPLADFADDVRRAGRQGWDQLVGESGLDVLADRPGQAVHTILGEVDMLTSAWHTATVLLLGSPASGVRRPGGRGARHELLAMWINLARMSPFWLRLEPEDALSAYREALGRAVDLPDLQRGDVFRWAGHVGLGLGVGRGAGELRAMEGGLAPVAAEVYGGVSQANRIPTEVPRKLRSPLGKQVRRVEEDIAGYLENSVP
ncbi:MAG: hypothetical protein NVSMB17_11640 [Candidatus Dormibacteria bacterium]